MISQRFSAENFREIMCPPPSAPKDPLHMQYIHRYIIIINTSLYRHPGRQGPVIIIIIITVIIPTLFVLPYL